MTQDPAAPALLGAIADVYEIFNDLYLSFQGLPGLESRQAPFEIRREAGSDGGFEIGSGAGFRATWWAIADIVDGRSFTFEQSLSWHGGEWIVEGSIIATEPAGEQRDLLELPTRYAVEEDDLIRELLDQARLLVKGKDAVWRSVELR